MFSQRNNPYCQLLQFYDAKVIKKFNTKYNFQKTFGKIQNYFTNFEALINHTLYVTLIPY
jgi:hypothetical protein